MSSKFASIDFEYYDTAEGKLKLVCCSVKYEGKNADFWLHDGKDHKDCKAFLLDLNRQGYILLAYNVVAEASAFISMGLKPLKFDWVDLYLEYRCLSNHNDKYSYGDQLIKGRPKVTKKPLPKWQRKTEADHKKADSSKQEYSMSAAVYKTLRNKEDKPRRIDTEFKDEIRKLIIACNSGEQKDIEAMVERKEDIMRYCASDVEYLEPMWEEMLNEYWRLLDGVLDPDTFRSDVRTRSNYACRTAIMERLGYPINVNKTRNFSSQVGNILWECQSDINQQFSETHSERFFRAKVAKRPLELSWNQKYTRSCVQEWCGDNGYKGWIRTDGNELSLSLKAFSKPISFRHKYPSGNLLAQFQRYLKLKQGLNGFTATGKTKKNFWDSVGKDGRVRPYMGIYSAQSSRSQPSATGFIPLKAAWMRSLIQPSEGRAICGIDFASQEFLLAALLSGDRGMLKAYESGDVYLAFGKDVGYIPRDGTKAEYKEKRDNCKPVILGLQFDMSEFGLATSLSEAFGRKVESEEALTWINKHKEAYPTFWQWKEDIQEQYKLDGFIRLADGWYMWGDNDNFRSVGNVPIQGMGACIMRKAVELAQEGGLDVIFTLHDALYIEFDIKRLHDAPAILAMCMDEAFRFYFPDRDKSKATVRLDSDVWGPDCRERNYELSYCSDYGTYTLPTKEQTIYIDPRSVEDYNKFSKYFEEEDFENWEF